MSRLKQISEVIPSTPKEKVVPEIEGGTIVKNRASVETWAIHLQEIYDNETSRLDASHYDQDIVVALNELKISGYELEELSVLADVKLPGQFARIWAEDEEFGLVYVNATDLMSLVGIGVLSGDVRYLSKETDTDISELVIQEGWLLMTCSGTIGRVFYVSKRFDGWVATHDLIRIIPKKSTPVGFLHAFLTSPAAQKQVLGHTHGGQIDHVTHHQVRSILVPKLAEEEQLRIHKLTMNAIKLREKAIEELKEVSDGILSAMMSRSNGESSSK